MNKSVFALAIVVVGIAPVAASAQSIDQLLANRTLLRTELDRCKQMGMASNDDARCRTARNAEQQRFFGSGQTYTPAPVQVFPDAPWKPAPSGGSSAPTQPSTSGPPHG